MASLDTAFILGLLVIIIVGFFAYQWISRRPGVRPSTAPAPGSVNAIAVAELAESVQIPGQTQQDLKAKEPLQQAQPASNQQQIPTSSFPGAAPAQFDHSLRHPEQLFHQPSPPPSGPSFQQTSDVQSGRASPYTQVGAGQQGFSPEMAANGGLLMGNAVMAFDSMTMDPMGGGLTAF